MRGKHIHCSLKQDTVYSESLTNTSLLQRTMEILYSKMSFVYEIILFHIVWKCFFSFIPVAAESPHHHYFSLSMGVTGM